MPLRLLQTNPDNLMTYWSLDEEFNQADQQEAGKQECSSCLVLNH